MTETALHIRDADRARHDGQFILEAFDSAIPHLVATGSERQWGNELFSTSAPRMATITSIIDAAEACRQTGQGNLTEVRVAEVDVEPGTFAHVEGGRMRVGGVVVKDEWWPDYIAEDEHLAAGIKGEENWAYLQTLISDFRAGEHRKGAGAKLLAEAKERARERGKKSLFVDCWAGNGRKLVGFYEEQGFVWVGDFSKDRPGKDTGPFEGAFFKMEL